MSNVKMVEEIRAKLEGDSRIPHPAEIAVSARAGDITLRGSVGGFGQRHAAAEIARSVRGVRAVENELQVDLRDRFADNTIRGVALQILMSDPDVPADRIDIHVAAGWLTLKGEVKHQYDSDVAFDDVLGLPGVGGITNEIKVITAGMDG